MKNMVSLYKFKLWISFAIIALLAGYFGYQHIIAPAPFFMRFDPEISYMESSLAIFKGQPYVYNDHPGTPVQLIGSTFLALTYPFIVLGHEPFIQFHLNHPEVFFILTRGFLTVTSIFTSLL